MPAYMPLLLHDTWTLCSPRWFIDDVNEPNDQRGSLRTTLQRNDRNLCPQRRYKGRLWSEESRTDLVDVFLMNVRRAAGVRVVLDVPPDVAVDYDLYVYPPERDTSERVPGWYSTEVGGRDERVVLRDLPVGNYWVHVWGLGAQYEEIYRLCWEYIDQPSECLEPERTVLSDVGQSPLRRHPWVAVAH
jgi:hypothetical protein